MMLEIEKENDIKIIEEFVSRNRNEKPNSHKFINKWSNPESVVRETIAFFEDLKLHTVEIPQIPASQADLRTALRAGQLPVYIPSESGWESNSPVFSSLLNRSLPYKDLEGYSPSGWRLIDFRTETSDIYKNTTVQELKKNVQMEGQIGLTLRDYIMLKTLTVWLFGNRRHVIDRFAGCRLLGTWGSGVERGYVLSVSSLPPSGLDIPLLFSLWDPNIRSQYTTARSQKILTPS